uniref:C2 domain-containing protein n=1 Tax=Guillardia theta (strain CCMP2712) TaxID=905079 RepID=A0A0C3T1Z0_GUITC
MQILVIRAVGLLASDPDGYSDPFVQLSLGPLVARTQAKRRTLNPFWNESFVLEYADDTTELKAKIIDQDPSTEQPIGAVTFPLLRLVAGETLCQWFPI